MRYVTDLRTGERYAIIDSFHAACLARILHVSYCHSLGKVAKPAASARITFLARAWREARSRI